jgi:hypothetical protein
MSSHLRLLVGRVALGPTGSNRRRFQGWADAFQNIECLKAAADDVIEQHFNSNYDAKVTGKRDGKLKKNRGWLASKY